MLDRFLYRPRAAIEGDDLVAAAGQAVDHIAAHAAEANEAKLHTEILLAQSGFRIASVSLKPGREDLRVVGGTWNAVYVH